MKFLLPLLFFFVLLNTSAAQIEWDRQYPMERLEDVLDIDISDDGFGFASGTDDLLLRLDPSTKRWELLPPFGDESNYESIDYLDGTAGTTVLAGGQGLIQSTDGGQSWVEIAQAPADIRAVKMLSPTLFIVIAKDGAFQWQDGVWTDLGDPTTATIEGGFILDENHMWLWNSSTSTIIYSTSNRGQSWNSSSDIADVDVLKFYDPLHGIATDSRDVYSSSDGGINWTLVSSNVIHNSSNDITFGSGANVIMAATFNADPTISFDGGITWDKFGTGLLNQRSFSIEAISDSVFYVGNDLSGMALTEDQGDHWVETSGPERSIVQDIVFVTRSTGFAVGQSGMLLRTFNGGSQWEDLSFGARSHFSIHGVDANDLWLGTSQRILHSTDEGITWDESGLFPTGNINKVFAISTNRILAASSSGEIYRSNNGGTTWDTMYDSGFPIRSIAKIDANTYMATGFNGVILRSPDQGENWIPLAPPVPGLQYEDVSFLNGEGWLVTSSFKKEMWHTSDQGNSWNTITLPIDRFWDG
ncbi:MAG: YCF48-related protein, partial [Saprospiraceae bacterium]